MSGWVAPVVKEVRELLPEIRITVALIPDWFTSGREMEFASRLPVDRVVGVFTLLAEIGKIATAAAPGTISYCFSA